MRDEQRSPGVILLSAVGVDAGWGSLFASRDAGGGSCLNADRAEPSSPTFL